MSAAPEPDWPPSRLSVLASRFAALLPARPHILDLAAGGGELFCALAPIIGRAQVWIFGGGSPGQLQDAFEQTAEWAIEAGYKISFPELSRRRALLVHTHQGAWRVEAVVADLAADPELLPLESMDAVVCRGLTDLVSPYWLEQLAAVLPVPLLAALNRDGHETYLPRHPADRVIAAGYRREMDRGKGRPEMFAAALAARGFTVSSAVTEWRVPTAALHILSTLVDEHALGASLQLRRARGAVATWRAVRARQIVARRLAIRGRVRDILALPARP